MRELWSHHRYGKAFRFDAHPTGAVESGQEDVKPEGEMTRILSIDGGGIRGIIPALVS